MEFGQFSIYSLHILSIAIFLNKKNALVEINSGNLVTSAYSRIQETLKTPECVYSFLKIEKKYRNTQTDGKNVLKSWCEQFKQGHYIYFLPYDYSRVQSIQLSKSVDYNCLMKHMFPNQLSLNFAQTWLTCSSFRDVIKGTRQIGSTSSKFSFFMFFTDFSQSSLSSSIQQYLASACNSSISLRLLTNSSHVFTNSVTMKFFNEISF